MTVKEFQQLLADTEVRLEDNAKTIQSQSAQIERLKAELELRTRERDQAIEFGEFESRPRFLHKGVRLYPAEKTQFPELYAHLAGRGE